MRRYHAHGKCLLAGEYGVLVGGGAVVCPVKTAWVTLELPYERSGIWVKTACVTQPVPFPDQDLILAFLHERGVTVEGGMLLTMNFPVQSRLGSSAAISAVIAKAFHPDTHADDCSRVIFEMAWALETVFHGQSSGVDVAGVLAHGPLFYTQDPHMQRPLKPLWTPVLRLSSPGSSRQTRLGVKEFFDLQKRDSKLWQTLNTKMNQAALDVVRSLESPQEKGYDLLANALMEAQECLRAWGAIPPTVDHHIHALRAHGAQAVKPTGSGHGGMVLSLWREPPPENLGTFWPLTWGEAMQVP